LPLYHRKLAEWPNAAQVAGYGLLLSLNPEAATPLPSDRHIWRVAAGIHPPRPRRSGSLRNEITTIGHRLARPRTLTRSYRHEGEAAWFEHRCESAYNQHPFIGGENYFFSADGRLMPSRKGQPAPDLRYFGQPR